LEPNAGSNRRKTRETDYGDDHDIDDTDRPGEPGAMAAPQGAAERHRQRPHPTAVRFHRACSWLEEAERFQTEDQTDHALIFRWTAFNAL
jgi:hypothetical protein